MYTNKAHNQSWNNKNRGFGRNDDRLLQEPIQGKDKISILSYAARYGSEEESMEAVRQLERLARTVGEHTEKAIESLSMLVFVKNKANRPAFRALCNLTTHLDPNIKTKAKEEIKLLAENAEDISIRIMAKEWIV
ncbi:MAG: hypothetical protein QW112_00785 [Candidatus Micrarchaeia archaeon]